MHKQALLISIILFLFLSACSRPAKEKIIGKWKLSKVGMETLTLRDTDASLEFTKAGKLIIVVDGDTAVSNWDISEDQKAIVLINKKNDKKNWNIISLTDHQLVCIMGNDTSTLTK